MQYLSTRGQSERLGFCDAVQTGLAPDGGLYLPEALPSIGEKLRDWQSLTYPQLALEFLKRFATDIPEKTLWQLVKRSYRTFRHEDVAPLVKLPNGGPFVLELFHGPTLAFKDFALQLLGNLYEEQISRTGQPINVLGATSGDTGSAAIHGLLGKEGVRIFILYPQGRIAELQERQMTCTGAKNVFPIAIEDAYFDDCQQIVKDLFGDAPFKREYALSAINSINLARVLAQCVYYVWAYLRLPEGDRERPIVFHVPTGNFGNVLAGWLTQRMGLPVQGFRVCTNQNDILYRLFESGEYQRQNVEPSLAPSMDIQVASNFERFLYYQCDESTETVRRVMADFRANGGFSFEGFDRDTFSASKATDAEIKDLIKQSHDRHDYVADPHTACAMKDLPADTTNIVLATAHPAKFPDTSKEVLGFEATDDVLEELKAKPIVTSPLPASAEAVAEFIRVNAPVGG